MMERVLLWLFVLLENLKNHVTGILQSKRASWEIPDNIIKEIARCLLSDIVSYCESEAGKAEFEHWKAQQAEMQKSKAGLNCTPFVRQV